MYTRGSDTPQTKNTERNIMYFPAESQNVTVRGGVDWLYFVAGVFLRGVYLCLFVFCCL